MDYKTKEKIVKKLEMGKFLFLIYTALSPLLTIGYLCFLIFTPRRGRIAKLGNELKERLSIKLPNAPKGSIWFHAASMGEVKAISVFAPKLAKKLNKDFFITTSTATGKKEAIKLTPHVSLAPIDFYPFICRLIKKTKPAMLVNAETEIWPASFYLAGKNNIPIYMVSARISESTYKLYEKLKPLTALIFSGVKKVLCQSEADAKRFIKLKGLENKVSVKGNLKYDQTSQSAENKEIERLVQYFAENSNIITAGCTHPEEEPIILEAFKQAKKENANLKLIIAPRHLEQIEITKKAIENAGLSYKVWPCAINAELSKEPVLLINKTGILQALYEQSTICFVGGTLDNTGGHNLLEPAIFGKPVLFGPNYKTAKIAGEALLKNKGGFIVHNANEIANITVNLNSNKNIWLKASEASSQTIKELQGATQRILDEIN